MEHRSLISYFYLEFKEGFTGAGILEFSLEGSEESEYRKRYFGKEDGLKAKTMSREKKSQVCKKPVRNLFLQGRGQM